MFNNLQYLSRNLPIIGLIFSNDLIIASSIGQVRIPLAGKYTNIEQYPEIESYMRSLMRSSQIHKVCFGLEEILRYHYVLSDNSKNTEQNINPNIQQGLGQGAEQSIKLLQQLSHHSFDDLGIMAYSISTQYKNIQTFDELCALFEDSLQDSVTQNINIDSNNAFISHIAPNKPAADEEVLDIISKLNHFNEFQANQTLYSQTLALFNALTNKLAHSQSNSESLKDSFYYTYDLPLCFALREIESRGMHVDPVKLEELRVIFTQKMKFYQDKIYEITGEQDFNIASPKQVQQLLFHKMQIHTKINAITEGQTKIDTKSTNAGILDIIADYGFEIARYIIEWRKLAKLLHTYIAVLQKIAFSRQHSQTTQPKEMKNNNQDRLYLQSPTITEHKNVQPTNITGSTSSADLFTVHCHLHSTITSTRRLSASEPNLQSIPITTSEGSEIRKTFVSAPGNSLIISDYSQIEIRLLAHVGKVTKFVELLLKGEDIHAMTASEIFGISLNDVSAEMRKVAKTVNFGIIYGISPFGLSKSLKISVHEAKKYIESYLAAYPEIEKYMKDTVKFASSHGYVNTIFNNRCYIENIRSKSPVLRKIAERAAINAPLQGSAADIMRIAIINLPLELRNAITMQIHDELIIEARDEVAVELAKVLQKTLEDVVKLNVPLVANTRVTKSWWTV